MKKSTKIILAVLIIIAIIIGIMFLIDLNRMKHNKPVIFSTWGRKYVPPAKVNTKLNIVTSLEDEITSNTAWCGTFNLIWNDLKNDLAKQDIILFLIVKMIFYKKRSFTLFKAYSPLPLMV